MGTLAVMLPPVTVCSACWACVSAAEALRAVLYARAIGTSQPGPRFPQAWAGPQRLAGSSGRGASRTRVHSPCIPDACDVSVSLCLLLSTVFQVLFDFLSYKTSGGFPTGAFVLPHT